MSQHSIEDTFMIPGMGAQPVPPQKYVAANDNVVQPNEKLRRMLSGQLTDAEKEEIDEALSGASGWLARGVFMEHSCPDELISVASGGYAKPSDCRPILSSEYIYEQRQPKVGEVCASNGELCIFDGIDFAPIAATPPTETNRGPYVATASGRKFYPLDPRPDETHIEDIAHGLSMLCRYNGAVKRFYSVAEHSVMIARSLRQYGPVIQLCGLLHDSPEALSGFGDICAPMKGEIPAISDIEKDIYVRAVSVRFGLPPFIPPEVHEADMRIRSNEVQNMAPMEWHAAYNNPLGVTLQYWTPDQAEDEFLAEYVRLERLVRGVV